MNHHLEYQGQDAAGNYGFWCPQCSRSVQVCFSPARRTVLFPGDESVPHGLRFGGLSVTVGPVLTGLTAVTGSDREFLSESGISW